MASALRRKASEQEKAQLLGEERVFAICYFDDSDIWPFIEPQIRR